MPKHIDNVIIPDRKRSIRNIPVPEARRRTEHFVGMNGVRKTASPAQPSVDDSYTPPTRPRSPRSFSRKRTWGFAFGALLVLLFAILSMFGGATLAYEPRSAQVTFNKESFSALKSGDSGLLYSVIKLSGEKGASVTASGEQDVSRKASGTIVVYNNVSAEAQRLVENTRFESAEGKVYRIANAISIPGKKSTGPGSLEVVVYADEPGASYNVGLTDFTVPGLRGTPRYETIYARSKTPMTGGLVGKERAVSAEALATAENSLRSTLSAELISKAEAEVPADFVLFPTLSSVDFESLPQTPGAEAGSVMINMKANFSGIMFKRTDLSAYLSLKKAPVNPGDPVLFESFDSLTLTFTDGTPADLLDLNKIDFKVSGSALLVWRVDEVALKSALVDKSKSELPQVLQNFPTVKSASATIRPFWKSGFPSEAGNITVKRLKAE